MRDNERATHRTWDDLGDLASICPEAHFGTVSTHNDAYIDHTLTKEPAGHENTPETNYRCEGRTEPELLEGERPHAKKGDTVTNTKVGAKLHLHPL